MKAKSCPWLSGVKRYRLERFESSARDFLYGFMFDGALGARGMHELRSYVDPETAYGTNAYTITSTYHGGTGDLTIYSIHANQSNSPQHPFQDRSN